LQSVVVPSCPCRADDSGKPAGNAAGWPGRATRRLRDRAVIATLLGRVATQRFVQGVD